ncbi:COMPASS complex subunit Sdc1, putative [Talaromyces stipitatus ATCC 10500]|uniref:COMPASS complex subunit Sdc1, putative n=1 Tax=Talaromyces stipitatus (strain ATCC 10500 / CBS 375.48 / QM 6759 / NRRL 1006) TaxID=441959 RepID=B8MFL3_TALSN|nr:COMPASS complex subunit Sdc1, putative [Talaromyces stipitatus ATCC 10500]EED17003.1 COMPASS complex subunit Sdc1, putative [Talaromyces stipitatus ATCC 10500]
MSSSTTPIGNPAETHNSTTPATTEGNAAAGLDNVLPKVAGGAPARIYLNEKITPYLLEGMKEIAREQPSNPLKVLGEFLIKKSNEVEQGQNNAQ